MTHEVSTRSLDETNVARIDAVCMRMRAACARSGRSPSSVTLMLGTRTVER